MNPIRIFLLSALVLVVFSMITNSVEAEDGLYISAEGDDGLTSYSSPYGEAYFTVIISTSPDDQTDVRISVDADDDSGWSNGQVTIYDIDDDTCSQGGETADEIIDLGDIPGDSTVEVCMKISSTDANPELGDSTEFGLFIMSNEDDDSEGDNVVTVFLKISDWFAYSEDDVKEFDLDATRTYTITVKNIKVNEDGEEEAITDTITIALSSATPGWNIDSDNNAWDKLELKAEINYIGAGASFDLELRVQLVSALVPASSYIGSNYTIVFTVDDGDFYQLVALEAFVHDYFEASISGVGNEYVNNGCSDDTASIGWTPTINNLGNTVDSFEVTFDTSEVEAASWDVDGATGFNTGNLLPKFEGGAHSFNVGLHVPGGLAAGTSNGFTVTVTSDTDPSVTQTQEFRATVTQCFGIAVSVDKTTDSANPGAQSDFTITVENTGNGEDTVSLMTMGASAWSPTLSESELTIASGASGTTVFSMTVPSDASANAQSGMAMVHAYSEGCGDDTDNCDYEGSVSVGVTANQVYDLDAGYYTNETDVAMSSSSVQEGMGVQMKFTITNNGNGNDEVTLSLENAPAWAVLGQTTALVGPGQTMPLTIDLTAPASDALGDYTFQVKATSADGTESATTGDLTVTVTEKVDATGGPSTEEVDEDDSPGFGIVSAIAALGAVLLIRRRS